MLFFELNDNLLYVVKHKTKKKRLRRKNLYCDTASCAFVLAFLSCCDDKYISLSQRYIGEIPAYI